MNHADHVALLQGGISAGSGEIWADFGSGTGAFTLALADLIGPAAVIYSIDKDRGALAQQERLMRDRFPQTTVHYLAADFTQPIQLPPLNGLVIANALHFHRNPDRLVAQLRAYLAPGANVMFAHPLNNSLGAGGRAGATPALAPGASVEAPPPESISQRDLFGPQPVRLLFTPR